MSKVLRASCENFEVTIGNAPAQEVDFLACEGKAESQGLAVLDEDKVYYLANTISDLKTTLEKVEDALTQVSSALNTLGGAGFLVGATGAVPWPGSIASQVSAINTAKTALTTLRGNLK